MAGEQHSLWLHKVLSADQGRLGVHLLVNQPAEGW